MFTNLFKKQSVKYVLVAIAIVALAVFVVLPLLPQIDSNSGLSLQAPIASATFDLGGFFGDDDHGDHDGHDDHEGHDHEDLFGGHTYDWWEKDHDNDHKHEKKSWGSCPIKPTCELGADPVTITKGESSTLTWETEHADDVSIDQGIGSVDVDGNTSVSPVETTIYTLTAKGNGGKKYCKVTVEVVEEEHEPVCTLNANPTEVNEGGTSKLTWTTDNADTVSIDQGVGSVDLDGSTDVTVNENTTYTLTAEGYGKTVTCDTAVTIKDTPPEAPSCPFKPESGRIIVDFDDRVRSDKNLSGAQTSLVSVNIPAGDYKVSLASWDGYIGRENVKAQPHEQWEAVVLDGSNTEIARSSFIQDVPDNVREASVQGVADLSLTISSDGAKVRGDHSFYPDKTSPNSVNPICAVFDPITPEAPTCELIVDPSIVDEGGNARVEWDSTNVTHVLIEETIEGGSPTTFEDTAAGSGSVVITPTATTTYFGTFTGPSGIVTCEADVVVRPVVIDPLLCTLDADPENHASGSGTSTLAWTTENADSVSIDQGVGSVGADGSQDVFVDINKSFTLTATRGNETKQCVAAVTVGSDAPTCDAFSINPSSGITAGNSATLSWETTNAVQVTIDQGVGSVDVDGDTSVTVNSDTTYTLTAESANGETVTCQTSATITTGGGGGGGGGGGSSSPRCDLFEASKTTFVPGEEITLNWETRRGREMTIEPNVLDTESSSLIDEGSIAVTPDTNTRYTLTVKRGSREDTCVLDVKTGGPEVTVLAARTISLTEVPYTGFDAGPTLTALFYSLLVLWSLAISYVLVVKRSSVLGLSLPQGRGLRSSDSIIPQNEYRTFGHRLSADEEEAAEPVIAPVVASVATIPANLPVAQGAAPVWHLMDSENEKTEEAEEEVSPESEVMSLLENRAHTKNVLLSSGAIRMIIGEEGEDKVALLDTVIERAKCDFPREDGWLVLNQERIVGLLEDQPAAKSTADALVA